jgi:hypothetical protein
VFIMFNSAFSSFTVNSTDTAKSSIAGVVISF